MASARRALNYRSRESSDYYFHVGPDTETGDEAETFVAMTNAPYFEVEGTQSDWHLEQYLQGSLHGLQMEEVMEGGFVSPLPQETVRTTLLQRGFRENPAFQELLQRGFRADAPDEAPDPEDEENILPVRPNEPPEEDAPRGKPIWERLDEDAEEEERSTVQPTSVSIGLIRKDPRKVYQTCDCCGTDAVYTFKAAHRILGVCSSSACMQKSLQKVEQWAQAAQSKSWGLLQQDALETPKPKLSLKEEILKFQKERRLDQTGTLDRMTEAALREAGREGMIPVWRERLLEETFQEDSWDDPDPV